MALPSDKYPDVAKKKAEAHQPEDPYTTLALNGPSSGDSVPDTCHLHRSEAVAPTQHLSTAKQSFTALDQTLNLPSEPLPAIAEKPRGKEPPRTEAIDPLGEGTQVLSQLGGRRQESRLDQ